MTIGDAVVQVRVCVFDKTIVFVQGGVEADAGVELFSFRGLGGVLLATVCSTLVTSLLAVLYQMALLRRKEGK